MVSKRSIYKYLIDFVYPNRCPVCGDFIEWDKLICSDCEKALPMHNEPLCEKCGKDRCLEHTQLYFDGVFTLMRYEGSGKEAIYKFKHDRELNFAEYSAEKLCEILTDKNLDSKIDCVTAVPMHKSKRIERGYNQAEKLAHFIVGKLKKSADYKLICRTADTAEQHMLSADERKSYAGRIFYPSDKHSDIKGKTLLLCDDVYTTGSTMNACSKILKEMGAEKIYCVAIATTLLK